MNDGTFDFRGPDDVVGTVSGRPVTPAAMGLAVAFLAAAISTCSAAESPTAIGAGMHAFHGGCYEESYERLSEAIAAGSNDPRAYYFRGLAARRSGREYEAEADFMEGARLEAVGDTMLNVGRSLERVQGADRMLLERYRAKARAGLAAEQRAGTVRRYSNAPPEPDASVFRRRRLESEESNRLPPPAAANAPTAEAADEDVFADEPEAREPATAEADEFPADSPAAETPKPVEPAEDAPNADPFGAAEGEPAERTAAEAEGAADAVDEQMEREEAGGSGAVDDFK